MFPKLWEIVAQAACENDCQIIATTHSYECIVGAVDGIKQAGKNSAFCFYRLGKNNTGSHVYRYSNDLLQRNPVSISSTRRIEFGFTAIERTINKSLFSPSPASRSGSS